MHRASPRFPPSWCCSSGSSFAVRRGHCRPLFHPENCSSISSCRFGGVQGCQQPGCWAASPSVPSRSPVPPQEPPRSPLSRQRSARHSGASRRGTKSKPNVSSNRWLSPRQPWEAARVGLPHEPRPWLVGLALVALQLPPSCPKYPGEQNSGGAACPSRDTEGAGGCCEQAMMWQQQDNLGVGDKITANKLKPSKSDPFGKGGRLRCKEAAAPWGGWMWIPVWRCRWGDGTLPAGCVCRKSPVPGPRAGVWRWMVPPQVGQHSLCAAGWTCWWLSSAEAPPRLQSLKSSKSQQLRNWEAMHHGVPGAEHVAGPTGRFLVPGEGRFGQKGCTHALHPFQDQGHGWTRACSGAGTWVLSAENLLWFL
nr:uncharacterized protein LOC110360191 [Columba livia]